MHPLALFGYSLLLRCSASNIQGTGSTEKNLMISKLRVSVVHWDP